MPSQPEAETADRVIWGRAVRAYRLRLGVTIEKAAANYEPAGFVAGDPNKGLSVQRWHQIEKGGQRFTVDQRLRAVKAIGGTLEGLELERARILGVRPRAAATGMAEGSPTGLVIPIWGRPALDAEGWKVKDAGTSEKMFDLRDLLAPSVGVMHAADDTMDGKVATGCPVIFDRSARPLEGRGCVVETVSAELYPRIYVGMDDDAVIVRTTASSQPKAFPRRDVKGVYAVLFWGG